MNSLLRVFFVTNLLGLSKKNKGLKCKVNSTKHQSTMKHIHRRVLPSKLDFAYCKIQVWGRTSLKTSHDMLHSLILLGCLYFVSPLCLAHYAKVTKKYCKTCFFVSFQLLELFDKNKKYNKTNIF